MTKPFFQSLYTHGFVRAAICTPHVAIGDPALNARYSRAMRARGMTVMRCSGDEALLNGMARIMHGHD